MQTCLILNPIVPQSVSDLLPLFFLAKKRSHLIWWRVAPFRATIPLPPQAHKPRHMHHLSQHQQHQQHLARGGTTQPRPDAHPRRIHCLTTTTHRHRVTPKQQQAPRVDPTCQPSTSSSSWQASTSSRRGLVLRSVTLLPPLLLVGSDDATTIVNSILSGYGLPTLTPSKGFKPYDEFEDDYLFECE